ncbi:MAG: M20/M25/M40 family metallo-hydrolase [Bacteriovoracaceae bacterium]|nr:M20/M25/M40 family metallo-hydrolase [Bacteriovoracaceae bacterium]
MKVRLVFIVYFLFLNFSFGSDSTNELKYLEELVSISSGTQDVEGVSSVQKNVASQLQNLGFEILENKSDVDTVKSTQTVAIKKGKNAKFITFVTHADTVFEKLNPFKWSDDKKRLVGSGVGDNKGGLVVTLYTIKNLLENPKFEYSIRVIISPNEETGSMGFRKQLKSYGDDSALILGMEPALEDGSIVEARKGVRWYHIKIAGREAHAGTAPENGVSACHELSKKIVKILDLNEYSKGNTINVGHVDGGKDKFNIVCGSAE